ncbi:MAG: bifunctional adenosylcobinamide kinase/adenosylcobinamide-phosphate guanylyltransferase [Defluviitaleaceae bacterium]|nr:bifunctional adenosylcobinamide kinase/adenosylcobinamide-phosphate guanylyltransferase [Defluviitaleaceae bacterium]
MILIIGGAYQGKLEYAQSRFGHMQDIKIVKYVDKWLLELVRENADITQATEQFLADNINNIVICNDISCGIVPTDPILRGWREEVGRFMAILAKHSNEVVRLYCGIPITLKGENTNEE